MDITVKQLSRVDLIIVEGRIDSTTAPEFGEALGNQLGGSHNIVVDLAGVEDMSSAGLRELVTALKRAKTTGGDVRLSAPSDRVREVLDLAGLDSVFTIYDDQVDAVGSF